MRCMQNENPMGDPRKGRHLAPTLLALLIFMMLAGTGFWIRDRFFAPSPHPAETIAKPGPRVMLNGKILGAAHRPFLRNGHAWLRMETIREYVDPYAWFDPIGEQVTFTTDSRVIRMHAGSKEALDGIQTWKGHAGNRGGPFMETGQGKAQPCLGNDVCPQPPVS